MAGTLILDTIKSSTTSPPAFQNTSGTEIGTLCRAWVNFNGTTAPGTIRASFNVSSVTRNATGDYTVNFTTAMPDANYSLTGTAGADGAAESIGKISPAKNISNLLADSVRFICTGNGTTLYNGDPISVAIFR